MNSCQATKGLKSEVKQTPDMKPEVKEISVSRTTGRPSKIKSAVYQHFMLSDDGKYFVCQVESIDKICGMKISAHSSDGKNAPTRASNLKRHLGRYHPGLLMIIDEKDAVYMNNRESRVYSRNASTPVHTTKNYTGEKVSLHMTQTKFRNLLIQMVVNDAVPLNLFSSPGFVGLCGEMATKFGMSLEKNKIRNLIMKEAQKQKGVLKQALTDRHMYMKLDVCSHQKSKYFAVNVQFVNDENEIVMRTLTVGETELQHTSIYLHDLVVRILDEFRISIEQIVLIVTDNACNMISAFEKLNEEGQTEDDFENDKIPEISKSTVEEVESATKLFKTQRARCPVHSLQLAIRDGLREPQVALVIAKLRNIAIIARMSVLDTVLKQQAGKGALLDQPICWGSTYLMIERLLELKHLLSDMVHPEITMTEYEWEMVKELEAVLRHPFNVTKKMQSTELTPGSFYKEWKNIIFHLSQDGGTIAESIKLAMNCRGTALLNNDVFLAAIYVDPLYRVTLTDDQILRARSALFNVAIKLRGLIDIEESATPSLLTVTLSPFMQSELDFENYLDEKELAKRARLSSVEDVQSDPTGLIKYKREFMSALDEVEKIDRIMKIDVKEAISKYPEIVQDAARIVTALPSTQVSIERLFSSLKFLKSEMRTTINDEELLNAILFLRSNSFY